MHRYETTPTVYHLDAYRVNDEDEFLELGVEELFDEPAITIVEWGDKFRDILPKDHLAIFIEVDSELTRSVQIKGTGQRSQSVIARLVKLQSDSPKQEPEALAKENTGEIP